MGLRSTNPMAQRVPQRIRLLADVSGPYGFAVLIIGGDMIPQVCGECYVGLQVRRCQLNDGSWLVLQLQEHLFSF